MANDQKTMCFVRRLFSETSSFRAKESTLLVLKSALIAHFQRKKKRYMYLGFQMTRHSFHPSSGLLSIDIVASFTSLLPGLLGLRRRFAAASVPQPNNFAIFNPRWNSCVQIERKSILDRLFDNLDEFRHLVAQKFTPLQYPDKKAKHTLRSVWDKNNTQRGRQVKKVFNSTLMNKLIRIECVSECHKTAH